MNCAAPDWSAWRFLLTDSPFPAEWLRDEVLDHDNPDLKELKALIGVQQSPQHHPEGDAFVHTLFVVKAMHGIAEREKLGDETRVKLMLAALCHDFGKATATRWHEAKQKWVAYGHEKDSVPLAREFLDRVGCDPTTRERVLCLVYCHMVHCRQENEHTEKAVRKIAGLIYPDPVRDLVLLCEADCGGRPPLPPGLPPAMGRFIEVAKRLEVW